MKLGFARHAAIFGFCVFTASASTINVPAGGDFQEALNSARAGDVITLAAGAVYKGPFQLPPNPGSGYITIRTNAEDSSLPAPGVRITPEYASLLPKLVADWTEHLPVIRTVRGSSHYQFIGVEISPTAGTFLLQLVQLGDGSETSLSELPGDFIFDRCYLHGDPAVGTRRGVAMNAPSVTVMNSWLADFKVVGPDSQALASWNSPGPITITNNYLEGAGENVLIGGQDPTIDGLVPTGITIRHNHFSKPLAWREGNPSYEGTHWTVKTLLEFKNARQVVVDGNLFENNWADAQSGFAILFTPRNQNGAAPWSIVSDARFTNNIIRHVASGINILGTDDIFISRQLHDITIRNNLFEDVTTPWGGTARLFQILNGALNITIDHNTGFPSGAILIADQSPSSGLVFTNNLADHGAYGFFGSGQAEGTATLAAYLPNSVFQMNGIIGGNAALYPGGNFFPAEIGNVGFVNSAAGDYRLLASSSLHGAATDGGDIGVNVGDLAAAQSSSPTPAPVITPVPQPAPGATPGPTTPTTVHRYDANDPAVRLTGSWFPNSGPSDGAGFSILAMDQGSQAQLTFTGTGVEWIGSRDPWSGVAQVYLDGAWRATIDTYSANAQPQAVLCALNGLSNGAHNLTLVVTGTRNANSGGAWVWIGAFDASSFSTTTTTLSSTPMRIEQEAPAVVYTGGSWFTNTAAPESGGSAVLSTSANARATVTFNGTGVTWIGYRDEWSGIALVYLDGALRASVDTYASPSQVQAVLFTAAGLASGVHSLAIEVTGTHDASSAGNWVWVDAFDVAP